MCSSSISVNSIDFACKLWEQILVLKSPISGIFKLMLTLKAFHAIIFIDKPIYTKNHYRKSCQSVTDDWR